MPTHSNAAAMNSERTGTGPYNCSSTQRAVANPIRMSSGRTPPGSGETNPNVLVYQARIAHSRITAEARPAKNQIAAGLGPLWRDGPNHPLRHMAEVRNRVASGNCVNP